MRPDNGGSVRADYFTGRLVDPVVSMRNDSNFCYGPDRTHLPIVVAHLLIARGVLEFKKSFGGLKMYRICLP